MTGMPGTGRRILVVEDDATNRSVIGRQLRLAGVDAGMAANGQDGLQSWRREDFALVLTDLHMPVMDGFGLVRAIREEEPSGTRTPVLALSADVRMGQAEKAREAGFDAFLAKPLQLDGLRAVLARWMVPGAAGDGRAPAAVPPDPPPMQPSASADAFDVRALREIVGDEPALMVEIVAYFDTVAADIRAGLLRAAAAGDVAAAGMLAHRLKSSARSVGALPLGLVCAGLEEHVDAGRGDDVVPRVEQVVQALDAALAAMRRWRDDELAAQARMTRYGL